MENIVSCYPRRGETEKTSSGRNGRKTLTFLWNKQRVLTKARRWCFCIQGRRFCWHRYWVQASRQYEIRHSRAAEQARQEQVWFSQVQLQLLLAPYLWCVFYFCYRTFDVRSSSTYVLYCLLGHTHIYIVSHTKLPFEKCVQSCFLIHNCGGNSLRSICNAIIWDLWWDSIISFCFSLLSVVSLNSLVFSKIEKKKKTKIFGFSFFNFLFSILYFSIWRSTQVNVFCHTIKFSFKMNYSNCCSFLLKKKLEH